MVYCHCHWSLQRIHNYRFKSAKLPPPSWSLITVTISREEKYSEQVRTVKTVKYTVTATDTGATEQVARARYNVKVLRSLTTHTTDGEWSLFKEVLVTQHYTYNRSKLKFY